MKNKNRYFLAELLGSCFLVMIIVGSGLMAENLTNDVAVMLIANTIATGAGSVSYTHLTLPTTPYV